MKVAGLPGEGGMLHPGNPERTARQNPDVKERPRTPCEKPHRRRQNNVSDTLVRQQAQAEPAELGVLSHIGTCMSSKIIIDPSSAANGDWELNFGNGVKRPANTGGLKVVPRHGLEPWTN